MCSWYLYYNLHIQLCLGKEAINLVYSNVLIDCGVGLSSEVVKCKVSQYWMCPVCRRPRVLQVVGSDRTSAARRRSRPAGGFPRQESRLWGLHQRPEHWRVAAGHGPIHRQQRHQRRYDWTTSHPGFTPDESKRDGELCRGTTRNQETDHWHVCSQFNKLNFWQDSQLCTDSGSVNTWQHHWHFHTLHVHREWSPVRSHLHQEQVEEVFKEVSANMGYSFLVLLPADWPFLLFYWLFQAVV